ncbi:MAG: hypothetical protein HUK01_10870 [Bacteroidaceae bacterium]|nr:hypothetical protein [Bacteroidaceae bacterium]
MEEKEYIKPTLTIVEIPVYVLEKKDELIVLSEDDEDDGNIEEADARAQETVTVAPFNGTYIPIKSNW